MVKLEALLVAVVVSGIALSFAATLSIAPAMKQTTTGTTTSSTSSTTGLMQGYGALVAKIEVGPTVPICHVNATQGTAPAYYSSIEATVTDSSGKVATYPVDWVSNGCYMTGTFGASLLPGNYSLNLTSCSWMGCKSALPKSFVIYQGLTTDVNVSIFTGIA
jgi:hypothetical protein